MSQHSSPSELDASAALFRQLQQEALSTCTLHQNIPYTTTNHHERQVLDLYIPNTHTSTPLPLIVYIHGGAFKFGSKETRLLPFRQLKHNYAIAAINYRRSGEALFPAMIQDCKSAIRFLKSPQISSTHNLKPTQIIVWGESAGAHAAAFLGSTSIPTPNGPYDTGDNLDQPSSIAGVISYYAPTNFLAMDPHLPPPYQTHNDATSPESLYLGAQITTIPELVREADPQTHIPLTLQHITNHNNTTASNTTTTTNTNPEIPAPFKFPPFFIAHGTHDTIVPCASSQSLADELAKHGVRHEVMLVEGAGHVFDGIGEVQRRDLERATDGFLRAVFGR